MLLRLSAAIRHCRYTATRLTASASPASGRSQPDVTRPRHGLARVDDERTHRHPGACPCAARLRHPRHGGADRIPQV